MAHPMHDDARKAFDDKLEVLGGKGEYPPDRAARIAGSATTVSAQGDSANEPEEQWTAAPPRQVSNRGRVKGD